MLKYVTSNKDKIKIANKYLMPLGIEVEGKSLDIVEIQADSIEQIAEYKAKQAFVQLKEPLLVNDAGWSFPALNGFPGAYMKYVNHWLSTEDFINLMRPHTDKTIIYHEVLCYIDNQQIKYFKEEFKGTFLGKVIGKGLPTWTLISLRKDMKSIAQCWSEGTVPTEESSIWNEFANWYKNHKP